MVVVLNTLFVDDHRARVAVDRRSIVVRVDGRMAGRFPLEGLAAIVLTGKGSLTTDAIGRCVEAGVRIAALKANGRVRFVVGGAVSGNVMLRVAQVRSASDRHASLEIARTFAAAKLQNMRRVLARWAHDAAPGTRRHIDEQRALVAERLEGMGSARTADAVRGYEGDASRRYFKALGAHLTDSGSPLRFEMRSRRPPRDPVNAALSYGYGLLQAELHGALEAVGLDPQVGFLHDLRPGRPALVLDVMEEQRPMVDRFVVGLLTRKMLGPEHFVVRAGGACYLGDAGRKLLLARWDEFRKGEVYHVLLDRDVVQSHLGVVQATLLARHLRGDIGAYPPYLAAR